MTDPLFADYPEMEKFILDAGWEKIICFKGHEGLWSNPDRPSQWLDMQAAYEVEFDKQEEIAS